MTRQTYDRAPRLTKLATAHISKGVYVREMAPPFNVVMRPTGEYTTMCVVGESPDTLQVLPHINHMPALEGPAQLTREELRLFRGLFTC